MTNPTGVGHSYLFLIVRGWPIPCLSMDGLPFLGSNRAELDRVAEREFHSVLIFRQQFSDAGVRKIYDNIVCLGFTLVGYDYHEISIEPIAPFPVARFAL